MLVAKENSHENSTVYTLDVYTTWFAPTYLEEMKKAFNRVKQRGSNTYLRTKIQRPVSSKYVTNRLETVLLFTFK
jgi:hypothetical protein